MPAFVHVASVLGNAVLLRSLPNTAQAEDLIPHHRQWLIKALQAGRQVIADFVGGEVSDSYRASLCA